MKNNEEINFSVNVSIKKEGDMWIAHCLELDIVATSDNFEKVKREMEGLIVAQTEYAINNDNLDHLFCHAPSDIGRVGN